MARMDYEKIKKLIVSKKDIDVDAEVAKLRTKLRTLSKEGALLVLANKLGVEVRADAPKAVIKTIDSLREDDDFVEIAGTIVNAYDLRFFEVCPACTRRVREQLGIWKCEKHGVVSAPAFSYLMNIMADDGTGVLRVTLFSRQVEKLLGRDSIQLLKFKDNLETFDEIRRSLIGQQFAFRGKASVNKVSIKLEFIAKMVFKEPKDVEPRVEAVSNIIKQQDKIPEPAEDDLDLDEELVID